MNKQTLFMITRLHKLGITMEDCLALRRIAMTLHRWHELECGTDRYCVVRGRWQKDRATFVYDDADKPHYEFSEGTGRSRYQQIPDRERGAMNRLARILKDYPTLVAHVQGDPRGNPLYILRRADIPAEMAIGACYAHGVAVHA